MAIGPSAMETMVSNMAMQPTDFWRGKRVLLTGHTGFKGAWLALWLQRLGAQVTGIALPAATNPALFTLADVAQGMNSHFIDIRDATAVASLVRTTTRNSAASGSPSTGAPRLYGTTGNLRHQCTAGGHSPCIGRPARIGQRARRAGHYH